MPNETDNVVADRGSSIAVLMVCLLAASIAAVLLGRVTGPSDLHTQTQIKTIAYTVDMQNNGRMILPRALDGEPATKPPLYNWLSLPGIKTAGTSEIAFKLPSVISGLLLVPLVALFARRLALCAQPGAKTVPPAHFGLLSALFLFASYGIAKVVYLARPDMLLTLFMTLAWILGTIALSPSCKRPRLPAFAFWLCIAGAFLSKGPAGLIPVAYVVLASKWIHGSWRHIGRIGLWWGLPLSLAIFACWQIPAFAQDPDFFARLWQLDVVRHAEEKGLSKVFRGPFVFPWYAIIRFLPWSLLSVAALVLIGRQNWRNHFLAPAILYGALVVIAFMLSPGHIWRYIIPYWPAGAMLAAFGWFALLRNWRHAAPVGAFFGAVVAVGLGIASTVGSSELRSGIGQNAVNFASRVREHTGSSSDAIYVMTGPSVVEPLLGIHPGANRHQWPAIPPRWVIRSCDESTPVVASEPTWEWTPSGPRTTCFGLYRTGTTRVFSPNLER